MHTLSLHDALPISPLTNESQGKCRLRLVGDGKEMDVPFSDAEQAREWMDQLMEKARCDL